MTGGPRSSLEARSPLPSVEHFDELGHDSQLALLLACHHDGRVVGIQGSQRDLRVLPRVTVLDLLALMALDAIALAGLGIGRVA